MRRVLLRQVGEEPEVGADFLVAVGEGSISAAVPLLNQPRLGVDEPPEDVVDRARAARYGVRVADAQRVIQTALGGRTVTTTVEGRERYPVRVRYQREERDSLERELIAFCREHLADVKCPRSVDFRPELPRHPTGKLYKRLLKDEYWAAAGRSI